MRKLVVALVLATVGVAPVFANPTPTAKEEPKKGEEVAAKADAPKAKNEKGAAILLTACTPCATDKMDKKDMKKDDPAQTMKPETTKPATTPKSI
jgi:hypothetical protein